MPTLGTLYGNRAGVEQNHDVMLNIASATPNLYASKPFFIIATRRNINLTFKLILGVTMYFNKLTISKSSKNNYLLIRRNLLVAY